MSIKQTTKQLLQCIAILLVILMTIGTMTSCSKDDTAVLSPEPEEQEGVLEVSSTNLKLAPGQEYARLIVTYKSPKGLYEPQAIKVYRDRIEVLGILDGDNKLFDLPQGTYTVTAGKLSITVIVETTPYCNLLAKFVYENVYQAPALNTACNSMGEFCTITFSKDGKEFVFKGSSATSNVPFTAIVGYQDFYLGLSGLIIGLPNIPEIGKTESQVVCFDLACSNCYKDYAITKPLTVNNGFATCEKGCKRTYDLNNVGNITKGEAGQPLYRYRVSYANNTLVVNNR